MTNVLGEAGRETDTVSSRYRQYKISSEEVFLDDFRQRQPRRLHKLVQDTLDKRHLETPVKEHSKQVKLIAIESKWIEKL